MLSWNEESYDMEEAFDWENHCNARLEDHEQRIKELEKRLTQTQEDHAKQLMSSPETKLLQASPSSAANHSIPEEDISEKPSGRAVVEHLHSLISSQGYEGSPTNEFTTRRSKATRSSAGANQSAQDEKASPDITTCTVDLLRIRNANNDEGSPTEQQGLITKMLDSIQANSSTAQPTSRELCILGIREVSTALRRHGENADLQVQGLAALSELSSPGKNHHMHEIKSAWTTCIRTVLLAMQRHEENINIQRQGCALLADISSDSAMKEVKVAMVGCIRSVMTAMHRHQDIANIQELGCAALRQLSASTENQTKIASLGGIDSILTAMRGHLRVKSVQYGGCSALKSLAFNNPLNRLVIAERGGIARVLDAICGYEKDVDIQASGCDALWNLCVNTEANQVRVASQGGIWIIQAIMKLHLHNEKVRHCAGGALSSVVCSTRNRNSDNQTDDAADSDTVAATCGRIAGEA